MLNPTPEAMLAASSRVWTLQFNGETTEAIGDIAAVDLVNRVAAEAGDDKRVTVADLPRDPNGRCAPDGRGMMWSGGGFTLTGRAI